MDILLINPRNIVYRTHLIMPPLGLASIGSLLEERGYSVKVLDLEVKPDDFNIYAYIKDLSPKIVGISGTTLTRFESFRIARIAKEVSGEISIIYGGCHATFTAEDTLTHIKDIDYIVHGEGEKTALELISSLIAKKDTEGIKGITFRRNKEIIQTPHRERIADLDSLSYSRELLEMGEYNMRLDFLDLPSATIMTSRGCPYRCSFCSASAMFGPAYTMRSAENVVDEIRYCIDKFDIKGVKFFDSTFTIRKDHVLSIAKELKKRDLNLPWECEIRADTVDRPLLKSMKEAGCYYVDLGIESASEKVLEKMSKNISVEQVINVLKWCRELGIKVKAFFTFGHIGETLRDAIATLDFIDRYFDYISKFAISTEVRIYPGTRVESYARQKGLLPKDFSWSREVDKSFTTNTNVPVLLQPSFGFREMEKVQNRLQWIFLSKDLDIREYFKKFTFKKISSRLRKIRPLSKLPFYILRKIAEIFKVILKSLGL